MDPKHIEWYFNLLKSKGVISEGWIYDGFTTRDDKIVIRYYHHTGEKNRYTSKNSSYSFPIERVIEELREAKLRQLLD